MLFQSFLLTCWNVDKLYAQAKGAEQAYNLLISGSVPHSDDKQPV